MPLMMKARTRFALLLPLFAHGVASAQAQAQTNACHEEVVPKRRIVLSWGGSLDNQSYKDDLKAFHAQFQGQSDLHLAAWQDGSIDKPSDVVAIKPTPAGLRDALAKIKADFEAHPTEPPEAYEVVMLVTNHGTRWIGETPDFGFTGDNASLNQAQLRAFGRDLPKGIRFKALAGTCYAQESLAPLMEGLRSAGSDCSCAVAAAAPGRTSTSPTTGTTWEQSAVRTSATDMNLFERRWSGAGYWIGEHTNSDTTDPEPSDNSYLSTSEMEVLNFLKRKFPELRELKPEEIEAKAASLHKRFVAEAGGLSTGMKSQLKESRRTQDKLLGKLLGETVGSEELAAEKKRVLQMAAFSRVAWNQHADVKRANWDANWTTYREEVSALGALLESERDKLNTAVEKYNKAVDDYNRKYSGRRLSREEKLQADAEMAELDRLDAASDSARSSYDVALERYNERVRRSPPRNLVLNDDEIAAAKILSRQLMEEIFLKESSLDEKRHFWNARSCELLPMKTAALPEGEQGSDAH
jgi:hypothetical protein